MDSWPRPRVGARVRLKNGKEGEVIALTKAPDVLRGKTELDAIVMGPRLRALYGGDWLQIYYEASVILDDDQAAIKIVTPQDIGAVIDS